MDYWPKAGCILRLGIYIKLFNLVSVLCTSRGDRMYTSHGLCFNLCLLIYIYSDDKIRTTCISKFEFFVAA